MCVTPDYNVERRGLRNDGVTEETPAYKAGIVSGDIIIQMGDAKIENIQDYMKVLGQHKKGDQIEVIVQRGDSRERMLVTF